MNDPSQVDLEPVVPGLFRETGSSENGDRSAQLIGAFCPTCGRYYFPTPLRCRSCLGAVEEKVMGAKGKVYSLTVVRTRAPMGLPEPYSVGLVDLDDVELRVFMMLDPGSVGEMKLGDAVELRAAPLGLDLSGKMCVRPFFSLIRQGRGER